LAVPSVPLVTNAPSDDAPYGPYHRLESDTQSPEVALKQLASGEVWGRPAKRTSTIPKAKAYLGVLPEGRRGIEFTTEVAPDYGCIPWQPVWSGPRDGVRLDGEFAIIKVTMTRNTQVEEVELG
jgi:hypothetical protein